MKKPVKLMMSSMLTAAMVVNMYGGIILADENEDDVPVVTPIEEITPDTEEEPSPEVTPTPEETPTPEVTPSPEVTPDPAPAPDDIENFVGRLYTKALGRYCDAEGLANWSSAIKSSEYTINEVARLFVTGEEFASYNYSNEDFVRILYNTFFDRPADPEGLSSWVKVLDDGASRDAVLAGFTDSIEWKLLCESYGIKNPEAVMDDSIQYTNEFVNRFYLYFLGRPADKQGRDSWSKLIRSGDLTACDVALGFVYSQEFMNSEHSTSEFVHAMFNAFLGRGADANGLESWGYLYEHGLSPRYFINGFAHSDEFANICKTYGIKVGEVEITESRDQLPLATCMVYDIYSALERPVGVAELNSCATMLLNKEGMNNIVKMVFLSNEYLALKKSNEQFATDVYKCILGRPANEDEISNVVKSLSSGTSRKAVIDNITSSSEFKDKCVKANVLARRNAAPTYLSQKKQDEINSKVTDLQSAFNYAASLRYWRHDVNPLTCSTRALAEEAINRGEGNCYGMAAVFLELAHNLGYEGVQIAGQVPSRRGGVTPHSWVELYIDGKTYVCDPDFTYGTGRNGLLIQYGQSGTWRYIRERTIKP